jgi:Ser/Thr protein kinase RdoA (MazF antagonist)
MMKNLKDIIEKNYHLPKIVSIKKINIRSTNNLYRINTEGVTFFLKEVVNQTGLHEKQVKTQLHIAEHLHKKGIKTIMPIENKKKTTLTKHKKNFYIMYPYVEIDKNASPSHFKKVIKILAEFHKAMEDFSEEHEYYTKPMHKQTEDITKFTEGDKRYHKYSTLKLAKKSKTSFAKKILDDSEIIKHAIIKVLHNLKDAKFTNETVLHYDFNKDNVFFSKNEFIGVSDFDYSHKGYVETDIAKAAKYWSENKDGTLDINKFKKFVKEYSKYNKISLDWKLYHTLVIYVVLRRIIHAAYLTLEKREELEWLYDKDMKTLRYIMNNEEKF